MIQSFALVLLTAFFLGGCSTTEEKVEKKKVYSAETNRAFEMIERGYNAPPLRAAPVAVTPPQVQRQRPVERQVIEKPVDDTPNVVAESKKSTPPKKRQSDKIIELNQNLAFYCMKHRKDPVFNNDEKKCMDHVERILNDCERRSSNNDSKTLSCVKNRLSHKL